MLSMRFLFAAVAAVGCLIGSSAAQAAGGCGEGYHRNVNGYCVPNGPACGYGYHRNVNGYCVPN